MDVVGLTGPLGSAFPNGTDLSVQPSTTPGDLTLTWTAVSTSILGDPADVTHYVVYADSQPIDRDAARLGTAPVLAVTTETTIEVTPTGGDRYYSVFVVDSRGNVSPY